MKNPYEASVNDWVERVSKQSLVERIWRKDPTAWKKDTAAHKEIKHRLGWLTCVKDMRAEAPEFMKFAEEVKGAGIRRVVLLGMGGSSLAPEVFQGVFGNAEGFPELTVLDSTDPGRVADVDALADPATTLFVVSSKSGGTIELMSFFKHFHDKAKKALGEEAGSRFIAITDPGTPLAELGKKERFRRVFLSPEDVGGRFSALTPFGLVPAALIGVDILKVLEAAGRAAGTSASAGAQDEASRLGIAMAVLAEEGRDKLTILASPVLEPFGDWAEQLVAESTGKEGVGVVPVVREPLGKVSAYGEDRFFVTMSLEDSPDGGIAALADSLEGAGHPVRRISIKDKHELGAEFFRWEFATALACALLKVNAFDQPDVQAAKDRTKTILKAIENGGEIEPKRTDASIEAFWENAEPGDYAAILAFLPDRPGTRKRLAALQKSLRDKLKMAVTLGFGPRYLHSTGQLHKGGPKNGVFFLITAAPEKDLPVPGEKYSFAQLELAQAMGDFEALESKGRWLYHARLEGDLEKSIDALVEETLKSLEGAAKSTK